MDFIGRTEIVTQFVVQHGNALTYFADSPNANSHAPGAEDRAREYAEQVGGEVFKEVFVGSRIVTSKPVFIG